MSDGASGPLRFDEFELDEDNALLTRGGRPVALPPKAFAVLCTLARQPGKLTKKEDLHVAMIELPDGSLDARYAFRHALYRHVFYQRQGASTRVQMHRRVAATLERSRAAGIAVTPTELASQHDAGLAHAAALRYYAEAARGAVEHFAPREAGFSTAVISRARELLERPQSS
jgi:hypothetical protein